MWATLKYRKFSNACLSFASPAALFMMLDGWKCQMWSFVHAQQKICLEQREINVQYARKLICFSRSESISNVKFSFVHGNEYAFNTGKPTWKWSSAWTRPTRWGRMRKVWASSMGTSSANHLITTFQNLMAPSPGPARNMAWTMKRFGKPHSHSG